MKKTPAADFLALQLRSVEHQIQGLRAIVMGRGKKPRKPGGLDRLYGVWRGKMHFSEKEIDAARMTWTKRFRA